MQTVDLERMTRDYRVVEKRFGSEVMWRFEPVERKPGVHFNGWGMLLISAWILVMTVGGFEAWKWWHR